MIFLRNGILAPEQSEALLELQAALVQFEVTFPPYFHFQQEKRGVNDSFAPSDLLSNWTAMYRCDSERLASPPLASLARL